MTINTHRRVIKATNHISHSILVRKFFKYLYTVYFHMKENNFINHCRILFFLYIYIYANIKFLLFGWLFCYDINLYNCTWLNKSLATVILSSKLRHTSSSGMTDSVTDLEKAKPADNDEAKRMKFKSGRHRIIKVYNYILIFIK
jgi:hypothetical protein